MHREVGVHAGKTLLYSSDVSELGMLMQNYGDLRDGKTTLLEDVSG